MSNNYVAVRIENATANSFAHNQRFESHLTDFLLPKNLRQKNLSFGTEIKNISEFIKNRRYEVNQIKVKSGGRSLKKDVAIHQEHLIILSQEQVKKYSSDRIMDCFKEYANHIQEKYGAKLIRIDYHRDEGHFNTHSNSVELNEHAHFIFENQDSQGLTIKRKMNFSKIQNEAHEIFKKLGFKRGINKQQKRDVFLEKNNISKEYYLALSPKQKNKILIQAGCRNIKPNKFRKTKIEQDLQYITNEKNQYATAAKELAEEATNAIKQTKEDEDDICHLVNENYRLKDDLERSQLLNDIITTNSDIHKKMKKVKGIFKQNDYKEKTKKINEAEFV